MSQQDPWWWFWCFDVCVPHLSFDVDPSAMWQQNLWWWFWWFDVCVPHPSFWCWPGCNVTTRPLVMTLMIWCLCSWSSFWCWPECNVSTRTLVMILMIWRVCSWSLTQLQCDNKTFGNDFDEFWWFDACVPHLSFDVDPAAIWQHDLWWWFWRFDVFVPSSSLDVDPAAMWQEDLWLWYWWFWCLCSRCSPLLQALVQHVRAQTKWFLHWPATLNAFKMGYPIFSWYF